MRIRAIVDRDVRRVGGLAEADPVSWVTGAAFEREFRAGRYRREWTWIAEDRRRIVARAVWWGRAGEAHPLALDCVWVDAGGADPERLGREVVAAGHKALGAAVLRRAPQYELRLPGPWREDATLVAGVDWRRDMSADLGLTDELERLQLEWHRGGPQSTPSGRLRFAPDADDAVFPETFGRVASGSLDLTTRRAVDALDDEAAAREQLSFYLAAPGDRAWWRLAYAETDRPIGFVIPSATEAVRTSATWASCRRLGATATSTTCSPKQPAFTHGVEQNASRQPTGTTNRPMAAAFEGGGYVVTERRLVFSAPPAA